MAGEKSSSVDPRGTPHIQMEGGGLEGDEAANEVETASRQRTEGGQEWGFH